MHNSIVSFARYLPSAYPWKKTKLIGSIMGLTLCWTSIFSPSAVAAASPDTAPQELQTLLQQVDDAANLQNIRGVMKFYSPTLTHGDGLTYTNLEQALRELWQRYPNLTYQTELKSWEADGNAIVAETVTEINGVQTTPDREYRLRATVRSRQRYENQQIVHQEILAEQSQLTSGENPPNVQINLPDEVKIGRQYNFDAIVLEPLGDDLLLGAALEEPISIFGYLNPAKLDLQPLNAGGLFKIGQAPLVANDRWISAVFIRHNGITFTTQRLQVSQ
jgi:hypothetical protein